MRMTLGVPVDPELQTPQPCGGTTSGSGSVDAERLSSKMSARSASMSKRGERVASTRARSHSGRSQRMGTTTPPTFQVAKQAMRCSGELRRHTATMSPRARPRSASTWASWVERWSSSSQVTSRSVPSSAAKMIATSPAWASAVRWIWVP